MANTIITKNSSTASAVPSAGSLTQGELAVNVTDKKLYTKNSGGSVVEITPTNATNVTGTTTASIPTSALASGTADASKVLLGNRTWGTLSGGVSELNGLTGDLVVQAYTMPAASFTAGTSSNYTYYWEAVTNITSPNNSWTSRYKKRVTNSGTFGFQTSFTLTSSNYGCNEIRVLVNGVQVIHHGICYNCSGVNTGTSAYSTFSVSANDIIEMQTRGVCYYNRHPLNWARLYTKTAPALLIDVEF